MSWRPARALRISCLLALVASCAPVLGSGSATAGGPAGEGAPTGAVGAGGDRGTDHEHAHRALDPTEAALSLDETDLCARVASDLSSLGSMSLGRPNAGALVNGVQMPPSERWERVDPKRAWATQETIDYLAAAVDKVRAKYPDSHPLFVGHLSKPHGGRIWPHRSHQSGRDVDISYYYVPDKAEWYRPAVEGTLDVERTWTFVRALITETDVEYVFINTPVQRMLKEHALRIGEDPGWLDRIFQYRSKNPEPIVKAAWGHRTHMHIRFYNPKAQELGRRAYGALVAAEIITPRHFVRRYRARAGDTLATIATKAGTSPRTFQALNGTAEVQEGRVYSVPMRGQVAQVKPFEVPPRRLPPARSATRSGRVSGPRGG